MSALFEQNAAYQVVTFMRVNWDEYGNSPLARDLKIPRRSTLVMFNEGKEVGRVVAQTSAAAIEPLFKAVI